jgi:hypothetical protein
LQWRPDEAEPVGEEGQTQLNRGNMNIGGQTAEDLLADDEDMLLVRETDKTSSESQKKGNVAAEIWMDASVSGMPRLLVMGANRKVRST